MLGGGRLAIVFHPGDGGFAEETVLVVHQMLVDTGSIEKEHRGVKITLIVNINSDLSFFPIQYMELRGQKSL